MFESFVDDSIYFHSFYVVVVVVVGDCHIHRKARNGTGSKLINFFLYARSLIKLPFSNPNPYSQSPRHKDEPIRSRKKN